MAAGRIILPGWMPAVDSDGVPIPNARMFFYENQTTTLATVYADMTLTTPLTNPVEANSSGQFPAIWADDANLFSVSVDAPYGPPGIPFTFDSIGPATASAVIEVATDAGTAAANAVVAGKADIDGENLNPATDGLAFNTVLEAYRRPFEKPLMDFVTDINAADWKPYFDAAVDWAAANAPSGVRFTLPRYVVPGGIPLSYVKPILSDGVYFVGKGRTIWTAEYAESEDACDIKQLASGDNPTFEWGNNSYDPNTPGGFTQRGGGLEGLNIRGWDATSWVARTKGVNNARFSSLWMWVPFKVISIENGLDPELERCFYEAYRHTGVEINGTGVGTGADPREGRGDRGYAIDVFGSGAGTDGAPTAPNPAFAIRGYWHTFDCSGVRHVKGGGAGGSLYIGDRRNGDANQRPHFITLNNIQSDYVANRNIEIDDARDVWFNGSLYLNGSRAENIRVGANAYNIHLKNPRGYASKDRMVTIAGTLVTIMGGSFMSWDNDGVSTEPCIYIEETANDVKIVGTTFGDPASGSDTSAGKRAIYAPPEAVGSLSLVGCGFYGLALLPVDRGNTRFTSAGCVTQFGPANVPMAAHKLFLGSQDYLPGSHSLYAVGDVAMAHGGAAAFFNSYYDGANFRRVEATAAGYVKNEATGLGFYQGPTGTAGATFSANLVARLNVDGTFRVQTKLGVGRDAVVGASAIATVGDISIGGGAPTACFNLYYDGSAWKYLGNGPGMAIRAVLDGSTPKMQVLTAPNNTGGPDAAATVSVVGYLATAP